MGQRAIEKALPKGAADGPGTTSGTTQGTTQGRPRAQEWSLRCPCRQRQPDGGERQRPYSAAVPTKPTPADLIAAGGPGKSPAREIQAMEELAKRIARAIGRGAG